MNFDGTIEALTRWVDIIEHRESLLNDLEVLAKMIKVIESAKQATTVIRDYERNRPSFKAFLQNEWTSCRIEDAYDYVQRLNAQRTKEERVALANQIINYLRNAERQIYGYVDSCRNVKLTTHLKQKIAQLKALKQVCEQELKKQQPREVIIESDDDDVVYYFEEQTIEEVYDYVYVYEDEMEAEFPVDDSEPQVYKYAQDPKVTKSSVIKTREIYGAQKDTSKVVDAHSTYGPIEYIRSGVGEECEYYGDILKFINFNNTVNQPEPDYVDGMEETEEHPQQVTDDPVPDDEKVTEEEVVKEDTTEEEVVKEDTTEEEVVKEDTTEEDPIPEDDPIPNDENITEEENKEETTEETIEDEPVPDDEKVTEEEIITEETTTEEIIEDEPVPDDEKITEEEATIEITEETLDEIIEDGKNDDKTIDKKNIKPKRKEKTKKEEKAKKINQQKADVISKKKKTEQKESKKTTVTKEDITKKKQKVVKEKKSVVEEKKEDIDSKFII